MSNVGSLPAGDPRAPGGVNRSGPGDVVAIIQQIASELGVDPRLALAIAQQESGLNPNAIGDNGHSVGLFQLNDQGEGAGMSVAQREDPATNVRIALTEVAQVAKAHPGWTPGEIAAAAQRPADRVGYANSVNGIYNDQSFSPQVGKTSLGAAYGGQGAGSGYAGGPQANAPTTAPDVPFDPAGNYPIDPAEQAWIRQNAGQDEWMLSNPELAKILGYAAQYQITDQAEIQSLIAQTGWYKTHSTDQRAWVQLYASDPQEAAREIQQQLTSIGMQVKKLGVNLSPQQLNDLAINSKYYGWTQDELTQAIGAATHIGPSAQGGNVSTTGGIADLENQMKATAQSYLVPVSDQTLAQYAQNIISGVGTQEGFKAYVQEQAKSRFPWMTAQLEAGMTVQQYLDPLRQSIAQNLQVDPNSIDFNQPRYQKLLATTDPKTGQQAAMPLWQAETTVRQDPTYGFSSTTNAKNMAYDTAKQLEQQMGAVI